MLLINADDWGLNTRATNNILACYRNGAITSASAMVFMEDSVRASAMALDAGLPTGLHLNFTKGFDARGTPSALNDRQQAILTYLLRNKYAFLLYNPALRTHFDYVYKAQFDDYVRLYNSVPKHIDGHHHMHLCMNMLIDKIIPRGFRVRRNFSFAPGEKSLGNRFYRSVIDSCLTRRYICTDYFFGLVPIVLRKLQHIVSLSRRSDVELMVHPGHQKEYDYLFSKEFLSLISGAK